MKLNFDDFLNVNFNLFISVINQPEDNFFVLQ